VCDFIAEIIISYRILREQIPDALEQFLDLSNVALPNGCASLQGGLEFLLTSLIVSQLSAGAVLIVAEAV